MIDADQTETEYIDNVGGSGYWYKFTYYNDVTLEETDLSTAQAVRGGGYNRYASIEQVRFTAGLKNNTFITDAEVFEALEEAEDQVKGALFAAGYELPLSEVPPMIRLVTRQLAAGILLTNAYGATDSGTDKDGTKRIENALKLLKQLIDGNLLLVEGEQDTPVESTPSVSGYPDDSTEDTSEDRMFSVSDVY